MPLLSDHVNVYSSCIALLDLQGWKIKIDFGAYEKDDNEPIIYTATRDETIIKAEDPLRLLGLAAIDEHHKPHGDAPYWWNIKSKPIHLLQKLEDEALERSFFIYKEKYPKDCDKLIENVISESKIDPITKPHERLGISKSSFDKIIKEKNTKLNL